ncbi:MAG: hypothetical protein AAF456_16590 [Planctomycetota bacterium]
MSLFSRLFGPPKFIRFDDSFALDRESLWQPVGESVRQEADAGRTALLIVHFTEMFTQIQEQLEKLQLAYEVVTAPLGETDLRNLCGEKENVFLVLAELLPEPASVATARESTAPRPSGQFSFIICDRHPVFTRDDRIEQLARRLPERTRMGYFLALDDVVIRRAIGDTTVQVLEQLGLGRRESLIASNVVSRRLATIQKRTEAAAASSLPADSAEEWYQLNMPADEESG